MTPLPVLYPILDAGLLAKAGVSIESFARELRDAGVRFLQYRDKQGPECEIMERAALLRGIFPFSDSRLLLNDRVLLVSSVHFNGVHLGQDDLSPDRARAILGRDALIGFSTHNQEQLRSASNGDADYLAIGPVFATTSKQNPDPIVGLEGIRAARRATRKPLVAIGGITRANCSAVLKAGADSVAVISDLLPRAGRSTQSLIEEFFQSLIPGHNGGKTV